MRLKELETWLKHCIYPGSMINQSLYNAKLQDPFPFTDNSKNIPFVTTYYENINNAKLVRKIRFKLSKIQSRQLTKVFKNKNVIFSQMEPKNLLRLLTRARFSTEVNELLNNRTDFLNV